jgi:hypothetical protein
VSASGVTTDPIKAWLVSSDLTDSEWYPPEQLFTASSTRGSKHGDNVRYVLDPMIICTGFVETRGRFQFGGARKVRNSLDGFANAFRQGTECCT